MMDGKDVYRARLAACLAEAEAEPASGPRASIWRQHDPGRCSLINALELKRPNQVAGGPEDEDEREEAMSDDNPWRTFLAVGARHPRRARSDRHHGRTAFGELGARSREHRARAAAAGLAPYPVEPPTRRSLLRTVNSDHPSMLDT